MSISCTIIRDDNLVQVMLRDEEYNRWLLKTSDKLINTNIRHEPYDLITRPIVVEYRGWTRLSPLANYHNLSGGLAVSTGNL